MFAQYGPKLVVDIVNVTWNKKVNITCKCVIHLTGHVTTSVTWPVRFGLLLYVKLLDFVFCFQANTARFKLSTV